ncbi:MAG: hypothetical protein HDR72_05930 [Ruminococcaceae bacterium]|nr:hypothetical protein [Oscillospiraceae bacterium]
MKKITSAIIIAALLTTLTACGDTGNSSSTNLPAGTPSAPESMNNVSPSSSDNESTPQSSEENSPAESVPTAPQGEPTFLIGLDGNPIYTSEITRLDKTDKTAETLTPEDDYALVYCEGFTYLKEPTGIAFNSYKNPELFDGWYLIDESPENTNEWKRVNVGDEICGLTVSKAIAAFEVNTSYCSAHFPEQYCIPNAYDEQDNIMSMCEFDGTITMEGFLTINQLDLYSDDGEMVFTPAENKLPIILQQDPGTFDEDQVFTTHHYGTGFVGDDIYFTKNETSQITFQNFLDVSCDMDGLTKGDTAYVRATFSNIKYFYTWPLIEARLDEVEVLSDILEHKEPVEEIRAPAPTL